jgi:hypothetical protein
MTPNRVKDATDNGDGRWKMGMGMGGKDARPRRRKIIKANEYTADIGLSCCPSSLPTRFSFPVPLLPQLSFNTFNPHQKNCGLLNLIHKA